MFDEVAETGQTTLHLDAPIGCSHGTSITTSPVLLQKWHCVVGCDVLETDDVRADLYADLEDRDWNRTRHTEAESHSMNVANPH